LLLFDLPHSLSLFYGFSANFPWCMITHPFGKRRKSGDPLLPALDHPPITCPPGRVARPQAGCPSRGLAALCTPASMITLLADLI